MRVLLITYYYPPMINGGVQRPLKMVKYLSRLGHDMSVLTSSHSWPSLTAHDGILRVYDLNNSGIHKLGWIPMRVVQKALARAGIYKSRHRYWLSAAKKRAETILKLSKPDLILASYPPHETLELGLHLSTTHDLPLISDFRDGLLFESIEAHHLNSAPVQAHLKALEPRVVQRSSAIVTVSEPISAYFRETYFHPSTHTIPNGFDPDDFAELDMPSPLDKAKFNLVYTGRMLLSDAGVNPAPFFRAVEHLVQRNKEVRQRLRLTFVGEFSSHERDLMSPLIALGIAKTTGRVPREQALAYQQHADLLLLITSLNRSSVVTGKLFEYMCAAKPMLALTHQTYAEHIIRETNTGWIVHPQNVSRIQETLYRAITDAAFYRSLKPRHDRILAYSRDKQMEKLHAIIQEVPAP